MALVTTNFLDRAIGWIAPETGLRRARARAALRVAMAYEGAAKTRSLENWKRPSTSANAEIGASLVTLRNGSRDLYRNNPYARKAINELRTKTVGTGLFPLSRAVNKRDRKIIDESFNIFSEQCDAFGRNQWGGWLGLSVKTIFESGEVLVRMRRRSARDKLYVPFQLQLLEPDYLDMNKNEVVKDAGFILQGVQFDKIERRLGYWLFGSHPGDAINPNWWRTGGLTSQFVPASEVLHAYEMERPGQVRGVPRCAPVIVAMRGLDELAEAIAVRKRIEACFSAFVYNAESELGSVGITETGAAAAASATEPLKEYFEPGMIQYMNGNKEIKFAEPTSSGAEPDYFRLVLRQIAAGWLMPYEILTGDLSQINYSSYRGGLLGFRDMINEFRWNVVIPLICDPIYRAVVNAIYIMGLISEPDYAVEWSEPKFDLLDREKEADADQKEIRIGTLTLPAAIAAKGNDPDEQLKVIAETNKKLDEAEIILDCDPRNTDASGKAIQSGNPAGEAPTQPLQKKASLPKS